MKQNEYDKMSISSDLDSQDKKPSAPNSSSSNSKTKLIKSKNKKPLTSRDERMMFRDDKLKAKNRKTKLFNKYKNITFKRTKRENDVINIIDNIEECDLFQFQLKQEMVDAPIRLNESLRNTFTKDCVVSSLYTLEIIPKNIAETISKEIINLDKGISCDTVSDLLFSFIPENYDVTLIFLNIDMLSRIGEKLNPLYGSPIVLGFKDTSKISHMVILAKAIGEVGIIDTQLEYGNRFKDIDEYISENKYEIFYFYCYQNRLKRKRHADIRKVKVTKKRRTDDYEYIEPIKSKSKSKSKSKRIKSKRIKSKRR